MKIGKKEATIIISIIGVTIAFFSLILVNRPIVDYKLALPKNFVDNYEIGDIANLDRYDPYLELQAQVRNRGGVDASVNLIVSLENASFAKKDPDRIFLENDTVMKIFTKPIAKQENYVYFTSHIAPDEDCESFSISYEIKKNLLKISLKIS